MIDLLRGEVRYFYDYRGGQVILNFDSGKVSVPYALMGDGFRALVRMLGLIVGGVDVAIIDEPETHLHPGFMEVITKYMVELGSLIRFSLSWLLNPLSSLIICLMLPRNVICLIGLD